MFSSVYVKTGANWFLPMTNILAQIHLYKFSQRLTDRVKYPFRSLNKSAVVYFWYDFC